MSSGIIHATLDLFLLWSANFRRTHTYFHLRRALNSGVEVGGAAGTSYQQLPRVGYVRIHMTHASSRSGMRYTHSTFLDNFEGALIFLECVLGIVRSTSSIRDTDIDIHNYFSLGLSPSCRMLASPPKADFHSH